MNFSGLRMPALKGK